MWYSGVGVVSGARRDRGPRGTIGGRSRNPSRHRYRSVHLDDCLDVDDLFHGCDLADARRVFAARVVDFFTRVMLVLNVVAFAFVLAFASCPPAAFFHRKLRSHRDDLRSDSLLRLLPSGETRNRRCVDGTGD